jgi:hypothetical protein
VVTIEPDQELGLVEIAPDFSDPFAYRLALATLHTDGPALLVDLFLSRAI